MEQINDSTNNSWKKIGKWIPFLILCLFISGRWYFVRGGKEKINRVRVEYYINRVVQLSYDDSKVNEALRYANMAISADEDYWKGWLAKGTVYGMKKRNPDSAQVCLRHALELIPQDPTVTEKQKESLYALLAISLNQSHKWEECIKISQEAHELYPDRAVFIEQLYFSYMALKDLPMAEHYANEYLGTHEDDARAYRFLARVCSKKGEKEKAIAYYKQALEIKDDTDAMWDLSCLIWDENRKEALNLRRKAAKLGDERTQNWFRKKGYEWE